jgi:hypothetical protein
MYSDQDTQHMQVTENWAKGYKAHFMEYIAPLSPGAPLLRWVGVFMAIMAAGSFTLLVSMLLLVWKVSCDCEDSDMC